MRDPTSRQLRCPRCDATHVVDRSAPVLLLGIGLGGFLDGIVLHQVLQWHHLLTATGDHPADSARGAGTEHSGRRPVPCGLVASPLLDVPLGSYPPLSNGPDLAAVAETHGIAPTVVTADAVANLRYAEQQTVTPTTARATSLVLTRTFVALFMPVAGLVSLGSHPLAAL